MRFAHAVFQCVRMPRLSDLSVSRCTICSYRHPMLSFPFLFVFFGFFCREFCSTNKDRTDQTAKKNFIRDLQHKQRQSSFVHQSNVLRKMKASAFPFFTQDHYSPGNVSPQIKKEEEEKKK